MTEIVTVPEKDELLSRLLEINSNPELIEKLYPILLSESGKKHSAESIATILALAIHVYAEGMDPSETNVICMHARSFLEILISDPVLAKKTRKIFTRLLSFK